MQVCTVFGRERKALLSFLARFDGVWFTLLDGGPRFRADGVFLAGPNARPFLLAPGRNVRHFRRLGDACLVTCGMARKDTVGLSSVTDDRLFFSLLRDLPKSRGGLCEVQEIPASRAAFLPGEAACLAAGLLLVCGMPPETLLDLGF